MNIKLKWLLMSILLFLIIWVGLRYSGLKFYTLPTSSMENSLIVNSKIAIWKTNFKPQRFETIMYYYPLGDTVLISGNSMRYYELKRLKGFHFDKHEFPVKYVPLSEREEWVGRCVGIPGDKVKYINGQLLVNEKLYSNENLKLSWCIRTKEYQPIKQSIFEELMIDSKNVINEILTPRSYIFQSTRNQLENLLKRVECDTFFQSVTDPNSSDEYIFPHDTKCVWNKDSFGEVEVPRKGETIELTLGNLAVYRRIIEVYEGNDLYVRDSVIYINGQAVKSYTPKIDYYFIGNDNRDNTIDSRHFGFLPSNHICGKILKVFK